jgi:hypothetical protein
MHTVALILMKAGEPEPGFHLHIDNPPWMPLDIEDILTSGPQRSAHSLRCALRSAERRRDARSRDAV